MSQRFFLVISVFAVLLIIFLSIHTAMSYTSGSPAGYTNSPYDNKSCNQCHVHVGIEHLRNDMITTDIPVDGYIANETYAITLNVAVSNTNKFGFICSPHDNNGNLHGQVIITDPTNTKIVSGKYITHTSVGTNGANNQQTWSFDWKAPESIQEVTFYAAFTAGNANNDSTFYTSYTVQSNQTGIIKSKLTNDASYIFPNPVSEKLHISLPATQTGVQLLLYNTYGLCLLSSQVNENLIILDVSAYPQGTYFLNIKTSHYAVSKRISIIK